jgi:two-component system phosphate regulon response regulator PhoB
MPHILCLDDEPETLDLMCLILRHAGYEVTGATSEEDALSLLRTQSIDLFTQDFMRPGRGGIEFLRIMKSDEALRGIPVLGISAGPREFRAYQLKSAGLDIERDLDGYVTKPFAALELVEAIAAALIRRSRPLPPPSPPGHTQ